MTAKAVNLNLEREKRAALTARDCGDSSSKDAARYYDECGRHLRNVKAMLPHGQFLKWCASNSISADQAARWMKEAVEPEKREERQAEARVRDKVRRSKNRTRVRHLPDEDEEESRAGEQREFMESATAWFNRAESAKVMASFAPIETVPKTPEMIEAVEAVIAAWAALLERLKNRKVH